MIKDIELLPSSKGRFEVTLDDELIFSKASLGRHAREGEVAALVRERIGHEVRGDNAGWRVGLRRDRGFLSFMGDLACKIVDFRRF